MKPHVYKHALVPGAIVAALAVAALSLSGCAAGAGAAVSSSPSASPTASSTPAARPLNCDALLSQAAVDAFMMASTPRGDALELGVNTPIARGPFAVTNAGGTVCQWGDVDSAHLQVRLLPHAEAEWDRLAALYASASEPGAHHNGGVSRGGDCVSAPQPSWCRTNVLVGSSWLSVDASSTGDGAVTEERFHALVQQLIPVVAKANVSPTAAPRAEPVQCASDAYQAALADSFRIPHATSMGVEETFRIDAAALFGTGLTICQYQPSNDGSGGYLGTLSVLPSATSSFETYSRLVTAGAHPAEKIQLTRGAEKVAALRRSATEDDVVRTYVDALVDGNWIQFAAAGPGPQPEDVTAYAQWVVANIAL